MDKVAEIPQEEFGQLFKRQIIESTYGTQGEKDTGLGLFLCQEFVENKKDSTFYFPLLYSSKEETNP